MFHQRLQPSAATALVALLLAGCGGGGSDAPAPAAPADPAVAYAASIALGSLSAQAIAYRAAASPEPASVSTTVASTLLVRGTNLLSVEHVDAAFPGMREVCVSGRGDSSNGVGPINLGVTAQSAAVLLDAGWHASADRAGAWAALAARGAELSGWENCGVKPEGAPSRSSRLVAQAGGGYVEDVYDGNPGTTFNILTQAIPPEQMAAMLSDDGYPSLDARQHPLRLYWRGFVDDAGRQLWIEMGLPGAGAPASTTGFIALYTAA